MTSEPLCKINMLVIASAIPASALDEDFDEEDNDVSGEERDDEKSGTRYNVSTPHLIPLVPNLTLFYQYSWFHVIFIMGAMYVAMLLTDW